MHEAGISFKQKIIIEPIVVGRKKVFMYNLYKTIRQMETSLNLSPRKIDKMTGGEVENYKDELMEKISQWEDENQKELKYWEIKIHNDKE
jgi:gas vesicle protein